MRDFLTCFGFAFLVLGIAVGISVLPALLIGGVALLIQGQILYGCACLIAAPLLCASLFYIMGR